MSNADNFIFCIWDMWLANTSTEGFVVVYDVHRPPGSRVVRLQTRCRACRVPVMEDVQDDTVYYIAMPAFLANGGDGYSVVSDNKINHHLTGLLDTDAYVQYIKMMTPLYQGLENRILFIDSQEVCNGSNEFNAVPIQCNNTITSLPTTQAAGSAPANCARSTLLSMVMVLILMVMEKM